MEPQDFYAELSRSSSGAVAISGMLGLGWLEPIIDYTNDATWVEEVNKYKQDLISQKELFEKFRVIFGIHLVLEDLLSYLVDSGPFFKETLSTNGNILHAYDHEIQLYKLQAEIAQIPPTNLDQHLAGKYVDFTHQIFDLMETEIFIN
jgi:hypothetical protein